MEKKLRIFFALLLTLNIFNSFNSFANEDDSAVEYAQSEMGSSEEVAPTESASEEEEEVIVDEEESNSGAVEESY